MMLILRLSGELSYVRKEVFALSISPAVEALIMWDVGCGTRDPQTNFEELRISAQSWLIIATLVRKYQIRFAVELIVFDYRESELVKCSARRFRVFDAAGNVIETHERKGYFREW